MAAWVVLRAFDMGALPILLLMGSGLFVSSYLVMSGSLPDAGRLRVVMTVVFGLIHGFGFAANLLEMQLPTGRIAELLVGVNLGVEIGRMSLVVGVTLLVTALQRLRLTLPRPSWLDWVSSGSRPAVSDDQLVESGRSGHRSNANAPQPRRISFTTVQFCCGKMPFVALKYILPLTMYVCHATK